jgi:hypothetical protein
VVANQIEPIKSAKQMIQLTTRISATAWATLSDANGPISQ